ncbi:MAG: LarC family nickel insertion protein, partial [Clostridiales bacterium]|nr:LarC family nickel insertion protein [Clostridiales bacterium]
NSLKVFLGETEEDDGIYVMETNVDDSTGEQLAYTVEQLIKAGARDAFCTPIVMKKGRPAYKLEVICTEDKKEELSEIIFRETTTIGLRYRKVSRTELKREMVKVDTPYGSVICKRVTSPKGQVYTYPEYEDLKKIATENNVALKDLYKLF